MAKKKSVINQPDERDATKLPIEQFDERGVTEQLTEVRAETSDSLADFDPVHHTRRRSGNNRKGGGAFPCISVIAEGQILVVYPDDATIATWDAEEWTTVKAALSRDRSKLALTKATDDAGVGIRRYEGQRVCIHVSVKGFGRAKRTEPVGTCAVTRKGDTFIFGISDQVIIEAA
jgi:hypothetical protein